MESLLYITDLLWANFFLYFLIEEIAEDSVGFSIFFCGFSGYFSKFVVEVVEGSCFYVF